MDPDVAADAALSVAEASGREAFGDGARRVVPRDLLVEFGSDAARAWYRGWDAANLAAPVEDVTPVPPCDDEA